MAEAVAPRRRKSVRLRGFDYSQPGHYFVTICTADRRPTLGQITNGAVQLSAAGVIVDDVWSALPNYYVNVALDEFVIMPNHLHAILLLKDVVPSAELPNPRKRGLSEILRGFKSMSARAVNMAGFGKAPFWQRGYYEHVVRNESELRRIRQYIEENPLAWSNDPENPDRIRKA
jgi:REP element-mobilizing transposase RayT